MYIPNNKLVLRLSSGKNDAYGQPTPGRRVTERCCFVKMDVSDEKTSVRADSSASRGNAHEKTIDAMFLLGPKTQANMHDIIEFEGVKIKIMSKSPRYDLNGRLDHHEVTGTIWVE